MPWDGGQGFLLNLQLVSDMKIIKTSGYGCYHAQISVEIGASERTRCSESNTPLAQ